MALRSAIDQAVGAKPHELTVGLDQLTVLDATLLSALIAGLRRVREVGGTVRLHVTRPELRRTLDVTGLDKVFELVTARPEPPAPKAPKRPSRRRRSVRRIAAAVVAAFLVGTAPGLAQQRGDATAPEQIIAKVIERNPSLGSFQAHVDVRLHTGIPFLNPTLEGTTYFKRPNNYEVVFTRVPSYAKGIDKLYSDSGDPSLWEKRFTISYAGTQTVNGHEDVVLRLVQRVRGMIDHEDVAIDTQRYVIEQMTYHYYNGGVISLDEAYRDEGGFTVLADQHATIALPHVPTVTGTAHYSDYHVNVAIDDGVFTERQTKDLGTK
ncbi:MAG: STAS domain-containing protein [Candidatus Eremiobacteraeota bacterium]|nr:STAS domain-containing protein [Candidatus Eremiobacteraeota bacterium]MBV8355442.1 STAS domain-containing protein [Candidatus Eremiobacteraeota bacterium]